MSTPQMFGEADLTKALSDSGAKLTRKVRAYLIGGCAMTFMGRKVATKDIDVVFGSSEDARKFTNALGQLGFASAKSLTGPYATMGAFAIDEKYGYKESWVRNQLASLAAKRLVRKRRLGREDFYSMTALGLSRAATA